MADKFEITKLDVFHIAEDIPVDRLDSVPASSGQMPIFNGESSATEWNYIDGGSPSGSFTLSQLRRGTKQTWTSLNPILAEGEIGLEIDGLNRLFKIG